MQVGKVVKSLKGHDTGRVYLVIAVVAPQFVLLADGRYRKLDNPKQKRIKHLEELGDAIVPQNAKDSDVRSICKLFQEVDHA